MKIQTQLATLANFQNIKLFSLSLQPPVVENKDISVFKFIYDKLGKKAFPYFYSQYATAKLYFLELEADVIRKTHRFLKNLQVWHVLYEFSFCRSV